MNSQDETKVTSFKKRQNVITCIPEYIPLQVSVMIFFYECMYPSPFSKLIAVLALMVFVPPNIITLQRGYKLC